MTLIRVALDEADFRTLVAGGTVKREVQTRDRDGAWMQPVEIALSDIGWIRMVLIINEVSRSSGHEPG